jgi:hypothetical protein
MRTRRALSTLDLLRSLRLLLFSFPSAKLQSQTPSLACLLLVAEDTFLACRSKRFCFLVNKKKSALILPFEFPQLRIKN